MANLSLQADLRSLLRPYGVRSKQVWADDANKQRVSPKRLCRRMASLSHNPRRQTLGALEPPKSKGKKPDSERLDGAAPSRSKDDRKPLIRAAFLAPLADKSANTNAKVSPAPCGYLIGQPGDRCRPLRRVVARALSRMCDLGSGAPRSLRARLTSLPS